MQPQQLKRQSLKPTEKTFDLKLNECSCKVYISYQCLNGSDKNIYEQEMQIFKELDDGVQYQQGIYQYQYIKVKNDQKKKEQNFRIFNSQSGENLVDEWDKVWCLYRIEWPHFMMFQKYKIIIQREGQESLIFQKTNSFSLSCKEQLDNDQIEKPRKFLFQNWKINDDIIESNEFFATNGKGFYLNQIYWEFQPNELLSNQNLQKFKAEMSNLQSNELATIPMAEKDPKQSVKELKTELEKKKQQNLELLDQNQQLKNQITEVNQKMEDDKKKYQYNLLFQKESSNRLLEDLNAQFYEKIKKITRDIQQEYEQQTNEQINQFKGEINQLQQQLCEKIVNTSFEQNAVDSARILDLENNNKIFGSEIILKSYQALKDSIEQLETEKLDSISQIQKSQQKAQTYQNQIMKLQNLTKNCNSKLEIYMQQVEKYEEEQRHYLLKNERDQKIIKSIKEQLNQSQIELEKYKNKLNEIESQILEVEEKNQQLMQKVQEQQQEFQLQREESRLQFDKLKIESESQLKSSIEKSLQEQENLKKEIQQQQMEQQKLQKQQLLDFMKNNFDLMEKGIGSKEKQNSKVQNYQDIEIFHLFKEKLEYLINIFNFKSQYAFPNPKYVQQMENFKIQVLNCKNLLLAYLQEKQNCQTQAQYSINTQITEYQEIIQKLKSNIIIFSEQIGCQNEDEFNNYFQSRIQSMISKFILFNNGANSNISEMPREESLSSSNYRTTS